MPLLHERIVLLFRKDTEKLPKLQPKSKEWERIVAVGFDDTDLTNVTDKDRGVVVSIPYNFSEDDVKKVIDALLEGFHTSTTTLAPTAAAEAPAQSSPVPIDTSTVQAAASDTDQTQVVNEDKGAAVKTPYAFTTTVVKKVIDTLLEVF
ncbi:hypothetical protein Y032_0470g2028 [Ancylostoma ceylanicum]|uniref:Uncharacterized protein n=1 Tax=Ancylostoma ceylanicum TaxID=53326 RepID=A0A016WYS6_9BILA|nr:hypothetical protein Y032_0470g2028 [Ancylostoma ceylanicum]